MLSLPGMIPIRPGFYSQIARRAGLSVSHLTRAVQGKRGMSFQVAARIACAAKMSLDQLYHEVYWRERDAVGVPGRLTKRELRYRVPSKFTIRGFDSTPMD